jgi:hypothetical protein
MSAITQVKTDYTAIALVVDRSGSMESVAEDTKGGVKQFLAAQKQNAGKASLSLAQFDHEYQVFHPFSDLRQVDENAFAKQYQPRGSTALVDAIGRTIIDMSQKIEKMDSSERPTRVVVAIVTDGQENSSHEFTVPLIKQLIADKQKLGWDFVFLGADLNAITAAQHYGFNTNKVAFYDASNVGGAFTSIGKQVLSARSGGQVAFSHDDRSKLAAVKV